MKTLFSKILDWDNFLPSLFAAAFAGAFCLLPSPALLLYSLLYLIFLFLVRHMLKITPFESAKTLARIANLLSATHIFIWVLFCLLIGYLMGKDELLNMEKAGLLTFRASLVLLDFSVLLVCGTLPITVWLKYPLAKRAVLQKLDTYGEEMNFNEICDGVRPLDWYVVRNILRDFTKNKLVHRRVEHCPYGCLHSHSFFRISDEGVKIWHLSKTPAEWPGSLFSDPIK